MDGLPDIHAFVEALDSSIENMATALKPAMDAGLPNLLDKCSLPQEKIELYHSHIYTVASLVFAYLKVAGVKTETHPIMKELARVQESIKAYKAATTKNTKDAEEKKQASEYLKRTLGTSGGKAAPASLLSPAISLANFKGKHTRFANDDSDDEAEDTKSSEIATEATKTAKTLDKTEPRESQSSTDTSAKVTKPKPTRKRKNAKR